MEEKEKSIGALWDKKGWFSGNIEVDGVKIPFVVFKNQRKTQDKHPDYIIMKPKPREG